LRHQTPAPHPPADTITACPYAPAHEKSAEIAVPRSLSKTAEPPSPALPKLVQTARIMGKPFEFIAEMRAELGDIFALDTFGMGRMVFLCTADLLQEVYRMPETDIVAGEIRHKQVGYLVGDRASINLDGEDYYRRRQILTPQFSVRTVSRYTETIRSLAEREVERWPIGEDFAMQPSLDEISFRTIARVLFGELEGERANRLVDLAERYLECFRSPFVQMPFLHLNLGRLTPWGRFLAVRQELYDTIDEEIAEREARGLTDDDDDVLAAMLRAGTDLDAEDAREAVRHECVGLIVGGAESASRSLVWTLLGMLQNPEIYRRMRREIDEVLGGRPVEMKDLCEMPYLDAVLHEGLRYQPAGPFAGPRVVKRPIRIGGFRVEPGVVVVQCMREVGRSEIFPYPDRFEPENFYGQNVKLKDWAPFGGGSRTCTGMGLARLEIAVVLATFVQRSELELGPGSVEPVRRGFVYEPENSLRVRVRSKS